MARFFQPLSESGLLCTPSVKSSLNDVSGFSVERGSSSPSFEGTTGLSMATPVRRSTMGSMNSLLMVTFPVNVPAEVGRKVMTSFCSPEVIRSEELVMNVPSTLLSVATLT